MVSELLRCCNLVMSWLFNPSCISSWFGYLLLMVYSKYRAIVSCFPLILDRSIKL